MSGIPDTFGSHALWAFFRVMELGVERILLHTSDMLFFGLGLFCSAALALQWGKAIAATTQKQQNQHFEQKTQQYMRLRSLVLGDEVAERLIRYELKKGASSRLDAIKRATDKLIYCRTRKNH